MIKNIALTVLLVLTVYLGFPVKNLNNELKRSNKLIRFIHAVPKFVGKDLEDYGPFEEEDIANLPAEIADVLIIKGRVEEIKES